VAATSDIVFLRGFYAPEHDISIALVKRHDGKYFIIILRGGDEKILEFENRRAAWLKYLDLRNKHLPHFELVHGGGTQP